MTNGSEQGSEKKTIMRMPLEGAITSVVIHLFLLIAAASITVLVVASREKVMFEAKKPPSIPARKLEHSIRVKQMQKQVRKPQILQRVMANSEASVTLPKMPEMDAPEIKTMRDQMISHSTAGSALGGLGGKGGGAGRGLLGGGGYSDTKFFGENVRTRAVCILMDISQSIVAKGILEDVRAESIKMLEKLNAGTKFNVIVFVDGALPFSPQMVYGTSGNKEKALVWLKQEFNGRNQGNRRGYSGSTPSQAIKMATEMGCDTMFVITDDPPYLKKGNAETGVEIADHQDQILDFAKSIETTYGRQVKIHTICYKPWDSERGEQARAFLKKVSRSTGGRAKHIKRRD